MADPNQMPCLSHFVVALRENPEAALQLRVEYDMLPQPRPGDWYAFWADVRKPHKVLKGRRDELRLTATECAEEVRMHPGTWLDIESGEEEVTILQVRKLIAVMERLDRENKNAAITP